MKDIVKVIKALEICVGENDFSVCIKEECPYIGGSKNGYCITNLERDALALLKEQEERIETLESLRRIEQGGRWKFTQIGENNKQIVNNGSIVMDFRKRKGEGKDDSN